MSDLLQQFMDRAKAQATPFAGTQYSRDFDRAQSDWSNAMGDNDPLKAGTAQSAMDKARAAYEAEYISPLMRQFATEWDTQQRAGLEQRKNDVMQQNDAQEQAALSALQAEMSKRAEAAQRTMEQDSVLPTPVSSLAPLQEITGVALNPSLAGSNEASQQFFVAPQSTASRFNVGASMSDTVGQRQRQTTRDIVSQPDNLNSDRRGNF